MMYYHQVNEGMIWIRNNNGTKYNILYYTVIYAWDKQHIIWAQKHLSQN